ncbi:SDR family oxidoreductase [Cereibacter sphaeroides]|uniref:SDR family oxidoreductase n=1 Tax=Cereibacter sphaeroides TaxID=1063 RepID=A0AAX1UK73_CERSP|nr:SDR family NAD(P)-dependent oxidoreductase [Cereibacter sphaeroides]RHZ94290.1 SDR family oxidoreductase [Cereibacter sphaeroides]SNT36842.1 3-oxoacyl-[acyl-carrier protein] reductase [[Luteovulum] sphaeroides subsp. megalophilum]
MNQIDLAGRVAVVTGGAQGIGRAVAERLIASGARVCLWDRDARRAAATAAELGGNSFFQVVDQVDFTAVKAATDATEATGGRIDILIANAGIAGSNAPVADYPVEEWHRIIDINLNGVFHCCKAVVPGMKARGYGRIVTVASIAGKEGNPNAAAYSASKAGVIALTKSLGKEVAGQDIAVNCVTPAAARTQIFDQMAQSHIDYMLSRIPRGRFLDLDEAAAMIAWLASAENSFTTGAVFDLSGGRATY